jgi:hypothetical protein
MFLTQYPWQVVSHCMFKKWPISAEKTKKETKKRKTTLCCISMINFQFKQHTYQKWQLENQLWLAQCITTW